MTKIANATIYPPSSNPESYEAGKNGVATITTLLDWWSGVPSGCVVRFSDGVERTFLNMPFRYDRPVKAGRA
jgi:hypothetical protein